MHAMSSMKSAAHRLHEEAIRAFHDAGHMLHLRSFWVIFGLVAVMAVLFALLVLFGNETSLQLQPYTYPMP